MKLRHRILDVWYAFRLRLARKRHEDLIIDFLIARARGKPDEIGERLDYDTRMRSMMRELEWRRFMVRDYEKRRERLAHPPPRLVFWQHDVTGSIVSLPPGQWPGPQYFRMKRRETA